MATADVLVLRHLGSDEGGGPASPGRPPAGWPGTVLPALLGTGHEDVPDGDVVHRYRGARALHAAGARHLEVSASPDDPELVRLTITWRDRAPAARARAAAVAAWAQRATAAGWQPADADELVGGVVVERYLLTDRVDEDPGVVLHDLVPGVRDGTPTRTSGRRT